MWPTPELSAALIAATNDLSQNAQEKDFRYLIGMNCLPPCLTLVMEAVCLLFGVRKERVKSHSYDKVFKILMTAGNFACSGEMFSENPLLQGSCSIIDRMVVYDARAAPQGAISRLREIAAAAAAEADFESQLESKLGRSFVVLWAWTRAVIACAVYTTAVQ